MFSLRQPLDEFTPMAEYRLWHYREIELNAVLEQLKSDFVVAVLGESFTLKKKHGFALKLYVIFF